jgi:hypothetical protein
MRQMKRHDLTTAVVLNTADNIASAALYRSVGFAPQYGIFNYQKSM